METALQAIPDAFAISPLHTKEYLVDGKLHIWSGPTTEVYSTIYTPNEKGEEAPTLLGSIPDMETETALEALDAAERAFGRGQGLWPTMKVADRIKCLNNFVAKMKTCREEVVKLLMW